MPDSARGAISSTGSTAARAARCGSSCAASASRSPPATLASRIEGAWPNPFNPRTNIRFSLADEGLVSLTIIDVRGALVRKLHDGPLPAGEHERIWNGLDAQAGKAGSGVYFARLATANAKASLKLILIR